MRILILGGTWFLGRLVAEDSQRDGFDVTVFNRGRGLSSLPEGVRLIRGDRNDESDLRCLAGCGPWDVVVDISGKVPAVVDRSARALSDSADRYLSVSTNLVYRDWPRAPVDENSPLRDCDPRFDPGDWSFDPGFYGGMKAGCERACRDAFGDDRVLILRLHEIIGQHEDLGPLLWWLDRMRRGGPVLVPAPDRAIRPIDARDASRFMVDLAGRGVTGIVNVAPPPEHASFGDLVRACAEVVGANAPELVWADEEWLVDQGVRQWTDLPLWTCAAAAWDMTVERAVAAGLRCRPLTDTVADTWTWFSRSGRRREPRRGEVYGMNPLREADLIARWRATAGGGGSFQSEKNTMEL